MADWAFQTDDLDAGVVSRYVPLRNGEAVNYGKFIDLLKSDQMFLEAFIGALAAPPYEAYLWETPAVSVETSGRRFEFVLINSPELATRRPDRMTFNEQFRSARPEDRALAFENLGGDAQLVVPVPVKESDAFTHLAAFSRTAPRASQFAFWRLIGIRMSEMLSSRPLWLSTNGLGVSWLHARIDRRPKYYNHAPYRSA